MKKFNKKIKAILSSELCELVGDLAFPMEPMQGFAGCNQFRRNNRWSRSVKLKSTVGGDCCVRYGTALLPSGRLGGTKVKLTKRKTERREIDKPDIYGTALVPNGLVCILRI